MKSKEFNYSEYFKGYPNGAKIIKGIQDHGNSELPLKAPSETTHPNLYQNWFLIAGASYAYKLAHNIQDIETKITESKNFIGKETIKSRQRKYSAFLTGSILFLLVSVAILFTVALPPLGVVTAAVLTLLAAAPLLGLLIGRLPAVGKQKDVLRKKKELAFIKEWPNNIKDPLCKLLSPHLESLLKEPTTNQITPQDQDVKNKMMETAKILIDEIKKDRIKAGSPKLKNALTPTIDILKKLVGFAKMHEQHNELKLIAENFSTLESHISSSCIIDVLTNPDSENKGILTYLKTKGIAEVATYFNHTDALRGGTTAVSSGSLAPPKGNEADVLANRWDGMIENASKASTNSRGKENKEAPLRSNSF